MSLDCPLKRERKTHYSSQRFLQTEITRASTPVAQTISCFVLISIEFISAFRWLKALIKVPCSVSHAESSPLESPEKMMSSLKSFSVQIKHSCYFYYFFVCFTKCKTQFPDSISHLRIEESSYPPNTNFSSSVIARLRHLASALATIFCNSILSFFTFNIFMLPSSQAKYRCFPLSYECQIAAFAEHFEKICFLCRSHSITTPFSPVVIILRGQPHRYKGF